MAFRRALILSLLACVAASPAEAQLLRRPDKGAPPVTPAPEGLPPAEAEVWPFPPPDPLSWWDDKRPRPPEAADPLGGRKLGRGRVPLPIASGMDASTYRLWGLMPLQWQVLRSGEMVLEVWVRPARSVRQSVVRVTVRQDGRLFVQARAGLACCEAGIARRVGFDVEAPAGSAPAFLALRGHPMWRTPSDVRVVEGGGLAQSVCVDGAAYDVTLVETSQAHTLHRACESAEIGQAADAIEPALRAALGHEPRFDVLFPGGFSLAADRRAYQELLAAGGGLSADPDARSGRAGPEQDAPQEEDGLLAAPSNHSPSDLY